MKSALSFLLPFVCATASAQTVLTDADLTSGMGDRQYWGRLVCHDPSVVVDNVSSPSEERVFVYGSHLGAGYTSAASDYHYWTSFGGGESDQCTLFQNPSGNTVTYADAYSTQAVTTIKNNAGRTVSFTGYDAHAWQYSGNTVEGNQWAPDIIYNPTMNKWLLYMSVNGDHWCSSIVCLASDSPEGPWVYQGPVVFSGFQGTYAHNGYSASSDYKHTDLEIALGSLSSLPTRYNVGSSWGSYWPNTIDPCVFYDESGNLWMSYGSWSGGIFILQLDETTGLRDYTVSYPYQVNGASANEGTASENCTSDPYFGTKIAGGWYVSGEASYIRHIGNYYFLFVTYGGLSATGGYQMRVFRSSNPDGPYKDCLTSGGISAVYSKYILNFGSDAKRDEGVKLMAGYQWEKMPTAEVAQGHNSIIADGQGRNLLVYHTRFNDGTEGHQVRVRQLFLNADGWLVASPYEFDGETVTDNTISSTQLFTADEVVGEYQFMAHPYRQNTAGLAVETPVNITLNAGGSVTGDYTGTWSLTNGTSYITLTLKGTATGNESVTFKGVLTRQTIDYTTVSALCFTALSSSSGSATSGGASLQTRGLSVWGSKANAKDLFAYILNQADIPYIVTSDLSLPAGTLGASVVWSSSDESIISRTGEVKSNGTVTLTVTMTKDNYTYTANYTVKVNVGNGAIYYPECGAMDYSNAFWTTFSDCYTLQAGNTCTFRFYNHTKGETNWQNWALYGCSAFSNGAITDEYFGIRADNWDNTSGSNTGCTCNYNWDTFRADMQGAYVDMTCSYTAAGQFTMQATITTTGGTQYTYQYTKTIADAPSQLILFFLTEASYIGGGNLDINQDGTITLADVTMGVNQLHGGNKAKFPVKANSTEDIQHIVNHLLGR